MRHKNTYCLAGLNQIGPTNPRRGRGLHLSPIIGAKTLKHRCAISRAARRLKVTLSNISGPRETL